MCTLIKSTLHAHYFSDLQQILHAADIVVIDDINFFPFGLIPDTLILGIEGIGYDTEYIDSAYAQKLLMMKIIIMYVLIQSIIILV